MPSPPPDRWKEYVPVPRCGGKVRKLTICPGGSPEPQPATSGPCRGVTVTAHYICFLANTRKLIDSSRDRGRPLRFRLGLGEVVRGLDAAVAAMSPGERSMVWIAGSFGYGRAGVKGEVPPDAPLLMEVEVLGWESA
jgi:FKBP-type peptidyl-prolyl cis-trans isomerase